MDYKQVKEDWITGLEGGSYLEILAVTSVGIAWYAFWKAVFPIYKLHFLWELPVFILPILVTFGWPGIGIVSSAFAASTAFIVSNDGKAPKNAEKKAQENMLNQQRKPFVSTYKALTMLYTCAAILAVDFPMFPRRFAKVETYGISLMDIGVGSFIFAQGLVSAAHKSVNTSTLIVRLLKSVKGAFPLIVLGLARLVFVKSADYQEHVSEYGVHWNFFLTLAMLPPLITCIQSIVTIDDGISGLLIGMTYQYALSFYGIEDFILNSPRTDFVSANREGILGLLGYAALFLLAKRIGQFLFPLQDRSIAEWKSTLKKSVAICIILNLLYLVASDYGFQTSRRMVNLMYISCSITHSFSILTLCLVVDIFLLRSAVQSRVIEAINRNQLIIFLLANVLTGVVNMSFKTIFMPDSAAFLVLTVYMSALCGFGIWLDIRNITLSFKL